MGNPMKFDPKECSPIDPGNPVWETTIKPWAEMNLKKLRDQREEELSELRKLDIGLGGILMLKMLLELPESIKKERTRDPVTSDGFGIPAPENLYDTPT